MTRLAVVGCTAAAQNYVDVVSRVDATFVAVADPDLGLARRTAAALGASISGSSLGELLEQHAGEFDAVLVHSPNCSHQQQAQQAIQAGKHVLVETPMALSAAGGTELAAAGRSPVRLMVGQAWRFLPTIQRLREKLVEGHLGQPGLLRVHRWESRPSGDSLQLQQQAERDGGTLLGSVVRDVDLVCWLLDRWPTEVFAVARGPAPESETVWDYVQLHLGFSEGAMALIDYYGALPAGDDYYSLSLIGSSGAAYADDHHNMQLLYRGGVPEALKTGQAHLEVVAELQEFLAAIRENREPSNTAAHGRRAVTVAEAAQQSIATGQAIQLTGE